MKERLEFHEPNQISKRPKLPKKKAQKEVEVNVIMTEEDEYDESDEERGKNMCRFNFTYNIEGEDARERPSKVQTQTVHTRGSKKKDKASSSRSHIEEQDPSHSPIMEEEEDERGVGLRTEREEIKLLKKIAARDKRIAEIEQERWLATENCQDMYDYLGKKELLADLVIDKAKRANKKEQSKPKKEKRVEYEEEQGSDSARVITSRNKEKVARNHGEERLEVTKKYIQEIVNQQLQAVGASHLIKSKRRIGRPYLREFQLIPFPSGYVVPKFRLFDGNKGASPDQHLAHFLISCGNTATEEACLLR